MSSLVVSVLPAPDSPDVTIVDAPCPTDPEKAANCLQLRRLNAWLLITSWLAYGCGVFFAYVWVLVFF